MMTLNGVGHTVITLNCVGHTGIWNILVVFVCICLCCNEIRMYTIPAYIVLMIRMLFKFSYYHYDCSISAQVSCIAVTQ